MPAGDTTACSTWERGLAFYLMFRGGANKQNPPKRVKAGCVRRLGLKLVRRVLYSFLGISVFLLSLAGDLFAHAFSLLWHFTDSPIRVNGSHDFHELPVVDSLGHISGNSQIKAVQ